MVDFDIPETPPRRNMLPRAITATLAAMAFVAATSVYFGQSQETASQGVEDSTITVTPLNES